MVFALFTGAFYYFFVANPIVNLANVPVIGRFLGSGGGEDPNKEATLTYWSLFEPFEVYEPLFIEYKNQNPNITVNYEEKVFSDLNVYKDSLLAKLINGEQTPDIVRIHVTWVDEFAPYLQPAPSSVFIQSDFSNSFYNPATDNVVFRNEVYAVPLMYDSLALLYNKDIFDESGATPPTTWSDFASLAGDLTKSSGASNIVVSGAAIGSADNIAHFSDILGLLMNQSNISLPEDMQSDAMKDVIVFYTNFVNEQRVWDRSFAYSPLSFAQGNVAMMFAPSWQLLNIIEENPNLNVGVVPVPQVVDAGSLTANSYPNFWVEAVNKNSDNKTASWKLISWMSEEEQLLRAFDEASKRRAFGEPYSRVALQSELVSHPYLSPFLSNADNGQVRQTTDAAGNDAYVAILKTVVEGVLDGGDIDELLATAKKEYERLDALN